MPFTDQITRAVLSLTPTDGFWNTPWQVLLGDLPSSHCENQYKSSPGYSIWMYMGGGGGGTLTY